MTAPRYAAADLVCDPFILVLATREAIRSRSPHTALTVARAIRDNAPALEAGAGTALARDIGGWLRGDNPSSPPDDDRPWRVALAALAASTARVTRPTARKAPAA